MHQTWSFLFQDGFSCLWSDIPGRHSGATFFNKLVFFISNSEDRNNAGNQQSRVLTSGKNQVQFPVIRPIFQLLFYLLPFVRQTCSVGNVPPKLIRDGGGQMVPGSVLSVAAAAAVAHRKNPDVHG